jgi:hypothetical protein
VIINNFNVFRTLFGPYKTDTPLIIDSYAVLSGTISPKKLKPISGRGAQIPKLCGGIECSQFALCDRLDVAPAPGTSSGEECFCVAASKASDHDA